MCRDMKQKNRVIKLSNPQHQVIRFLSERLALSEIAEGRTSIVTVTRTGKFFDRRYGEFEITREMLLSFIENFKKNVYGQEIVLDKSHRPDNGAAGFFRDLYLDGNRLLAKIEWTPYGVKAVRDEGFIYVSADYSENYEDNEERKKHGPTLLGAGLTPRPVVKHLDRVTLSCEHRDEVPLLVSEKVIRLLQEEIDVKKLLEMLKAKLGELKLSEGLIKTLSEAFEKMAEPLADDARNVLLSSFIEQGETLSKTLAEGKPEKNITLSIESPTTGISADDVKKLLTETLEAQAKETRTLAENRQNKIDLFNKTLSESETVKALSEDSRKILSEAAELITAEMSDDAVKALADNQIKLGTQLKVNSELAGLGYQVTGSPHITVDESNNIKVLQEEVDNRLQISNMPESKRFSNTGGKLQEENKQLADEVLEKFDRDNAIQLHAEHKMLSGGSGITSDVKVPSTFERTVIREALYQLVGLQYVDSGVAEFASSHEIPYSYRDTTAAGKNSTRVYEGGSILRAGVIQTSELAYPIPQKLAFEVSDELRYLTSTGRLDWNALIENQRNASRIIAEDTEQLIFNEVVNASDEYGATVVSNENLGSQTDSAHTIFVTTQFPVVRPRVIMDLKGTQVGSTINPITITLAGSAIVERAGQTAAGTYYVMDYNLGEFYFVDENDAIQVPGGADTLTISYSYATNVAKFDTDLGADSIEDHWDKYLTTYGKRIDVIQDDRFHMVNYGIMKGTLRTNIEQAKKFSANYLRPGTSLNADGNLGRIKDIPNFKTSAPGLNIGEVRAVVGERGVTRFRLSKAWAMGELENQKDASGNFTGKKQAYGDQFIVLHTPTQLKRANTSIVNYSTVGRVSR